MAAEKDFQQQLVARRLGHGGLDQPRAQLRLAERGDSKDPPAPHAGPRLRDRRNQARRLEPLQRGVDLSVAFAPEKGQALFDLAPDVISGHRLDGQQPQNGIRGGLNIYKIYLQDSKCKSSLVWQVWWGLVGPGHWPVSLPTRARGEKKDQQNQTQSPQHLAELEQSRCRAAGFFCF